MIKNDKDKVKSINEKINELLKEKFSIEKRINDNYEKVRDKQETIITMSLYMNNVENKIKYLKENQIDLNNIKDSIKK